MDDDDSTSPMAPAERDHALISNARRQVGQAADDLNAAIPSPDAARSGERRLPSDSFTGYEIIREIHRGGQGLWAAAR